MDEATTAALVAVVIAVFAMLVAIAQAVQQYFITGQAIRICDRVVYGKMPGKGSRMWVGSQFRFRVVYTIPQICLRPDLWEDGFTHHSDPLKETLPDLRHDATRETEARLGRPKRTAYSAIPGEASWASFCRVMQFTTGNDLVYELVEGDADRCPSDLQVVPMLVSLRDVVTIALTAGMTCTNASFKDKVVAMEGRAGTITSSLHPILGALLRFTPKSFDTPPGIRVCNGSVDPDWMVRMWDVLVVAGRRYSVQDRKYYAAYENDSWMLSTDMAVVRYVGSHRASRASSPTNRVRRHSIIETELRHDGEAGVLAKSPLDGDWSFEAAEDEPPSQADEMPAGNGRWRRRDRPDAFASIAQQQLRGSSFASRRRSVPRPHLWGENFAYKARGHSLLDGVALQNYIEEKRQALPGSPIRKQQLLLPSFPGEGSEYEDWQRLCEDLSRDRAMVFAQRWRDVVERRQKRREKHDMEAYSARSSRQTSRVRSSSQASQRSQRSHRSVRETRGRSREPHPTERPGFQEDVLYGEAPFRSGRDSVVRERSVSHERLRPENRRKPVVAFEGESGVKVGKQDGRIYITRPTPDKQRSSSPARSNSLEKVSPSESSASIPQTETNPSVAEPRSILRRPRARFPEDPNPVREGVAPLRTAGDVPPQARWTKIDRRRVSPEALKEGLERFEEDADHVIVLRVLSREEIEAYAVLTRTIRDRNEALVAPDQSTHTELSESPHRIDDEPAPMVTDSDGPINTTHDDSRVRVEASENDSERPRSRSRERLRSPERRFSDDSYRGRQAHSPSRASNRSATIDMPRRRSPLMIEAKESVSDGPQSSTDFGHFDGSVNWFWICQADVMPGYFATPWPDRFSPAACSGAIAVMLTALEWFTDDTSLCYTASFPHCTAWIHAGRTTHPSYAINAMGGIIVAAKYRRVRFDALDAPLPPIELLPTDARPNAHTLVQRLAELMALDSWLAFCGRLPAIYNGRSNLIRRMPALVQKLMDDFAYEFGNVDRTAAEGGWQLIKELADLLLHELDQMLLTAAEQLFTLVAVLRAAKMAMCVAQGSSTAMLQEILLKDAQVYLV